jgi:hypothetical protein
MKRLLLAALLAMVAGQAHAACTAGASGCTTDTTSDAQLAAAINDPVTQLRVWNLWNGQCANIFSETASTTGHTYRNAFCLSIAAQKVPYQLLVSEILNSTTIGEITGPGCAPTPGPLSAQAAAGGIAGQCLVDADVNTAIGSALTVTLASAETTATAPSGSQQLTVASVSGIITGQSVSCDGCAAGTVVTYIDATNKYVYLSQPTSAALSSTEIAFTYFSGLPVRAWP